MEAPPPYMAPKPKSKTGLIVAIVLGILFLCCGLPLALTGGGIYWMFNKGKGFITCTVNFQEVSNAMKMYTQAHDGKLPDAAKWQDEIRPFYEKVVKASKDRGPFEAMKADGDWGCVEPATTTGMAFNSDLSGKKLSELKDAYQKTLIFEVPKASRNAHQPYKKLDKAASPDLMGMAKTKRGWFTVTADHSLLLDGKPVSGGMRFDVKD